MMHFEKHIFFGLNFFPDVLRTFLHEIKNGAEVSMGLCVCIHPCITDPSKSTPSKSPSKGGDEIESPSKQDPENHIPKHTA